MLDERQLDQRKAAILSAVVQQYIETAQPVGSSTVSARADVAVSSATVRNDMTLLEREGYLVQPHTSAGRIPTEKGYRFFVDNLTGPGPMNPTSVRMVREFFATAHGEIEHMLAETSRLLSDMTGTAAVVVGESHDVSTIRSVQLIDLATRTVLAIMVMSNGVILKRTIDLDADVDVDLLADANAVLAGDLVGSTASSLAGWSPPEGVRGAPLAASAASALAEAVEAEGRHVFVDGRARIAGSFDARETIESVLGLLEQQFVVVSLLKELVDGGLAVSIGSESGVAPLADCSLVVAPYAAGGEPAGAIAVLGPTRMNYPETLSAVAVVSQRLEQPVERRLRRDRSVRDPRSRTRRHPGRDQEGVPEVWPGSRTPTPTPTTTPPRPASRSSRPRTRCCRTPPSVIATTASATPTGSTSPTRSAPVPAGSVTCSTRSSVATTPSAAEVAGVARRGRPVARTSTRQAILEFTDAVFGCQCDVSVRTAVRCEACDSTGAEPGTSAMTCPDCGGGGEVRVVRQTVLGQIVSASACPRCSGQGMIIESPCHVCSGAGRLIEEKTYTVDVPAGVDEGSTLRLTGRGAVGVRGGAPGDLYVRLRVKPHDRFVRHGEDLVEELDISMVQAALGAHLELETLDGTEDLIVPRGTQAGKVFKLKGRGVPRLDGRGRGDLLVRVGVEIPTKLDEESEALLRNYATVRGEEVAPADEGFFSRFKTAFKG